MTITDNKKIHKARIIKTEPVCENTYYIETECGSPIEAKAGQFVSVLCNSLTLRRPFCVYSNNNGRIGILFKERGKGTTYLKSLKENDILSITGPFGNGFKIETKKSLIIGAGIGTAPVAFLREKLNKLGINNYFIAGFKNKNEIIERINADEICTDDGSYGLKGSVIDYLNELINKHKPQVIYACGPEIVLKIIAQTGIKYGIETQISMEKVMACSIGVCRGCIINIKKGDEITNASVCKDGPVFYGNEVVWQKIN